VLLRGTIVARRSSRCTRAETALRCFPSSAPLPSWLATGAPVTFYAGSSTQPSVRQALEVPSSNLVFADAALQNVTLVAHQCHLADKNGFLDLWIHPQRLAVLAEEKGEG
jgi:hypothetical protein